MGYIAQTSPTVPVASPSPPLKPPSIQAFKQHACRLARYCIPHCAPTPDPIPQRSMRQHRFRFGWREIPGTLGLIDAAEAPMNPGTIVSTRLVDRHRWARAIKRTFRRQTNCPALAAACCCWLLAVVLSWDACLLPTCNTQDSLSRNGCTHMQHDHPLNSIPLHCTPLNPIPVAPPSPLPSHHHVVFVDTRLAEGFTLSCSYSSWLRACRC